MRYRERIRRSRGGAPFMPSLVVSAAIGFMEKEGLWRLTCRRLETRGLIESGI